MRRTAVKVGLILATVVLSAVTVGCHKGSDAYFAALRDGFFVKHLSLNPVTSTYLGGSAYSDSLSDTDGRLRDYSPKALARELGYYRGIKLQLEGLPKCLLSSPLDVDYDVLKAQVTFLVHQLSDVRISQYAIETYVIEAVNGVNYQLQQLQSLDAPLMGTEAEWNMILARVGAVPEYLAVAQENLAEGKAAGNLPDWRLVERDGVQGSQAAAQFFREDLLAMAHTFLGDRPFAAALLANLETTCANAAGAYDNFGASVQELYPAKDAVDRYAIGEQEYQWRIHNNFGLTDSVEDLYAYGDQQVGEIEARLFDTAAAIAAQNSLNLPFGTDDEKRASTRAVLGFLAQDAPANDAELLEWYGAIGTDAVAYGRLHGMFDIPETYELDIVETPPVLRSSLSAAYNPAPPFKPGAVGQFYVTPTGDDPALLADSNRSAITAVAVHEGFPGHDWHYKFMTEHKTDIANIRWLTIGAVQDMSSMWSDSMGAEGWAHYTEQLMSEPVGGSPLGFYSQNTYVSYLRQALLRAARVRVDIGIHTGRMTYDEAVDYLATHYLLYPGARENRETDPDAAAAFLTADREIFRYSKWPTQALAYNIGKRKVLELRETCRQALGDGFSEKTFHEHVMVQGTISPALYADAVLASLSEAR